MSDTTRGYFNIHGGGDSPLAEFGRFVEARGTPDGPALRQLAEQVRLPVAAVRGALSFYDDLHAPPHTPRICRGTSCQLAGAEPLFHAFQKHGGCRGVYCLGYCDRAPVVLTPDNRVLLQPDAQNVAAALGGAPGAVPPPAIRCFAREPVVTGRLLQGDCADLDAVRRAGVYDALWQVLCGPPARVLEAVERSGERGRGGAGFPTGVKWRRCAEAAGETKYVIANGDEGDPGSFIDRELMERDPHSILEGLILCAYAVGAREGIVFIRSEYPHAVRAMENAIAQARAAGILGKSVFDSGFAFNARVFPALGSYVCGEETALLNAIEGMRGEVRLRPPYPVETGLYGKPTVVDNVETLVNVPWIVRHGPDAYRKMGTTACPGTKALCLNHGFARPGIVEVEFGVSLRDVLENIAGGGARGANLAAVLVGGPMGSVVPPDQWDVPICLTAMGERGFSLGHGGIVAIPENADFAALLRHLLEFMQHESCGKCVPCRIGSQRALELAREERGPLPRRERRATLERIMDLMAQASLCAFGRETPGPVRQLVRLFGDRIFGGGGA